MKICKDGRISGQNNKEAGNHLGILTGKKKQLYIKKGWNQNSGKTTRFKVGQQAGDKNPMYGKTAELSPRWKGGISPLNQLIRSSLQYRQWRKSVFERDRWKCLICNYVGGDINAHHVKSFKNYPELRFEISNGITLCERCHRLVDKKLNNEGRI